MHPSVTDLATLEVYTPLPLESPIHNEPLPPPAALTTPQRIPLQPNLTLHKRLPHMLKRKPRTITLIHRRHQTDQVRQITIPENPAPRQLTTRQLPPHLKSLLRTERHKSPSIMAWVAAAGDPVEVTEVTGVEAWPGSRRVIK